MGLLLATLSGCAKISGFDKPGSWESFMVSLEIDSSVKGMPAAASTNVVSILIDSTGSQATIYGLPKQEAFPIIPENLFSQINKTQTSLTDFIVPTISGFKADVIDRRTLKVTGFYRMSTSAKDLELEVEGGTIYRKGPGIATTEPILIKGRAGPFKKMFPDLILQSLKLEDGTSFADLEDRESVNLYAISFRGDAITIL